MNILEVEDTIKGLPDARLQQEAQQPTGQVPQYLVISEIQRRTNMRKQHAEQGEMPHSTVAQQIISEGIASAKPPGPPSGPPQGPPQGPPPGMAPPGMPPQGPPPGMPPPGMYGGGRVRMRDMGQVPGLIPRGDYGGGQYFGMSPEEIIAAMQAQGAGGGQEPIPRGISPEDWAKMDDQYGSAPQQVPTMGKDQGASTFIPPLDESRFPASIRTPVTQDLLPNLKSLALDGSSSTPEMDQWLADQGDLIKRAYKEEGFGSAAGETIKGVVGSAYPLGVDAANALEPVFGGIGDFARSLFSIDDAPPERDLSGIMAALEDPNLNPGTAASSDEILTKDLDDATVQGTGSASATSAYDRLLAMAGEKTPTPDYSDLIEQEKKEGFNNALIQLGAGIAGGDMSKGIAAAGKVGIESSKNRRELAVSQREAESRTSSRDRQQDIMALAAAGDIEQASARAAAELIKQNALDKRSIQRTAEVLFEATLGNGMSMIDVPEDEKAERVAAIFKTILTKVQQMMGGGDGTLAEAPAATGWSIANKRG